MSTRVSWINVCLLGIGLAGCAQFNPSSPSPTVAPAATPLPVPSVSPLPPATPVVNVDAVWQQATDRAISAATLAQSAQSRDDWMLITNRWQQAIALLRTIPKSDIRYAQAQNRIAEYQRNLVTTQQRANIPIPNVPLPGSTTSPTPTPTPSPIPTTGSSSDAATVALATHLSQTGSILYTTTSPSCGDCQRQRELFGEEAIAKIAVIECNPNQPNARVAACQQANVTTYPTWQINGQLYTGVQSLEQLATLSNYTASGQKPIFLEARRVAPRL